jgi:hypothetical protein
MKMQEKAFCELCAVLYGLQLCDSFVLLCQGAK